MVARRVTLQRGKLEIDLETLDEVVRLVIRYMHYYVYFYKEIFKHIDTAVRFRTQTADPLTLLRLFYDYERLEATDPRDKVYALLGLVPEIKIIPDYECSMAQVRINTAKALILDLRNLNLLCFDRCVWDSSPDIGEQSGLQIPSWVADFGRTTFTRAWTLLEIYDIEKSRKTLQAMTTAYGWAMIYPSRFLGTAFMPTADTLTLLPSCTIVSTYRIQKTTTNTTKVLSGTENYMRQ